MAKSSEGPPPQVNSTPPLLGVRMRHRIGTLNIDVDFTLDKPWTILFGPSGSGKTTILRAIAGLLRPDTGRIVSTPGFQMEGSVTLLDTDAGVFVPAHQRSIRLATQQPNLFPHMTVLENLAYGMPTTFVAQQTRAWDKSAREALDGFELAHLSDSHPGRLSGGEAQRLNLARAVAATGSRMLLLDEPFTGMDGKRRDKLLPYLQNRLAESAVPVLSVTHDVAEAFQLGAEVITLANGRVVDQGPVEVVLAEERARLLTQLNGFAANPA